MDKTPQPKGAARFGFNRVYRTNLRPVVLAVTALSALWTLLSAIGFFRSISTDKQEGVPKLAAFEIVLGSVYMILFLIETTGFIAAASQRLALVRLFAYLSLAAIVLITGGGIFQIVVHFTSKSDILKECTNLVSGTFAVYPFGFFGPTRHETIDQDDAAAWCKSAYDHDSWASIVSLLIYIFLVVSFSTVAWGYYRQVLDPTSVVNFFTPAPSHQFVAYNAYPMHSQPYNASAPNLGYNAPYAGGAPNPYGAQQQSFAPPPGPPPTNANQPGHGAGASDKENPFADFDERTERPAPGGSNV